MFKIGDFSRLTRVSVRMLRHYDQIGLLKPHAVDEFSGYRYYTADQFVQVNRVYVLRELGFTLAEICTLLQSKLGQEHLLSLLQNRKREITAAMAKEQDRLLRVETLIKSVGEENLMKFEVAIKSIPEYMVASIRGTIPAYTDEGRLWEELQNYAAQHNVKGEGTTYAIYHDPGYKENDNDVEVAMCINGSVPETDRVKVRVLEAVPEMAVVMHQGPFEEITSAYQALGSWMGENRYELSGPTRAIYHKGPWCEGDPANYLTEIQAPVTKQKA